VSEHPQKQSRPVRFDWREWQGQLAVQAMNKPGIEKEKRG